MKTEGTGKSAGRRRGEAVLLAAAGLGFSGVALGAAGAHGLEERLAAAGMTANWGTAVDYQLAHAIGLLALGVWSGVATPAARVWLGRAAVAWAGGTVLFSGSLYGLCLGAPGAVIGPLTPIGGLALLTGWALLVPAARADSGGVLPGEAGGG